jgi:parallel beta-helix repeat protein
MLVFILSWSQVYADFYVIPVPVRGKSVGTEIESLPYTVTSPGFYYITKNLNSTGAGITVNANDVTIDLMGYSITGAGILGGTSYGIYTIGRQNIEVRNGTIRLFYIGIYGNNSTDAKVESHRYINVRAMYNAKWGIKLYGLGHLVKGCIASHNGDGSNDSGGIRVGEGSLVNGNIVHDNNKDGIYTFMGCTVTNNTAYNNQGMGIYAYSGSVTENSGSHNGGFDVTWTDNAEPNYWNYKDPVTTE